MWEAIVTLAKTPAVVALVVGLFGLLFYMVKKGMLSFKGKGVTVGLTEADTRNLIQAQLDYANAKCEGMISKLPKDLDTYRTKYVIARVEDVIEKAIIFNNMVEDEPYIRAKQELVYQTIMKRVDNSYFMTDDFKAMVYKFVDDLFKELVRMKRCFS